MTGNASAVRRLLLSDSVKFLLVESGILGFGIRNTAQGTGIQNPRREVQNPLSRIPLHGASVIVFFSTKNPRCLSFNALPLKSYCSCNHEY